MTASLRRNALPIPQAPTGAWRRSLLGRWLAGRYDRRKSLERGRRAATLGLSRLALRHYEEILAVEPDNPELHVRVAPLYARVGQAERAWTSYTFAGRALLAEGKAEHALSLFQQAARRFPDSVKLWEQIADIHERAGRRQAAIAALMQGAAQFRHDHAAELALRLLMRAFRLQPFKPEPSLELARLLAKTGRHAQAKRLLRDLHALGLRDAHRVTAAQITRAMLPWWRRWLSRSSPSA